MAKIKISSKKITSYGGLFFTSQVINNQEISKLINNVLGNRAPQSKYKYSDIILSLFHSLMLGGSCVEDILHLVDAFKNINNTPFTPSLIPSPDTLAYALQELAQPDDVYYSKTGTSCRVNDCFMINKLIKELLSKKANSILSDCLDVDTSINSNKKKDGAYTYNGKLGYNPIIAGLGKCIVDVELRSGNASPKFQMMDYVMRILEELKFKGIQVRRCRIDSAGFNFELIENLNELSVIFYIRAVSSEQRNIEFGKIKDWRRVYIGRQLMEVSEIMYEGWRYVVWRKPITGGQKELFSNSEYKYFSVITNDSKNSAEWVLRFYANRGSYERCFDYLNNDWGWGKLPFRSMGENAVWMSVCAFCNNLFEIVKKELSQKFTWVSQSFRTKRFVLEFLAVPAKLVKRSRSWILTLFTENKNFLLTAPT